MGPAPADAQGGKHEIRSKFGLGFRVCFGFRYSRFVVFVQPAGRFILMLRLYWPEESIIKGGWKPAPVVRAR